MDSGDFESSDKHNLKRKKWRMQEDKSADPILPVATSTRAGMQGSLLWDIRDQDHLRFSIKRGRRLRPRLRLEYNGILIIHVWK